MRWWANPFQQGVLKLDAAKVSARRDGQVRTILASGDRVAIVVLGGLHDLSESVRQMGQGKVEYVRLTPIEYAK